MKLVLKKAAKKSGYEFDLDRDGVTQSNLGQWLDCSEKSRKSLLLGLTGSDASKPLIFGGLSHEMLDKGYSAKRSGKKLPKTLAMDALSVWKSQNPHRSSLATEIAEESSIILHHLLPVYFDYWHDKDSAIEWVSLEEEFKTSIRVVTPSGFYRTIPLRGKRDAQIKMGGKAVLFETKNKGRISASLMDQLPLDLQLDTYLCTWKDSAGLPASLRVLYNILKRPGERRKNLEPLMEFGARIADNARKKPEEYFFRYEMTYTRQELEQKKERIHHLVGEFAGWVEGAGSGLEEMDPGFNPSQCEGKYGTCEFLKACSSGSAVGLKQRSKAHPELEG